MKLFFTFARLHAFVNSYTYTVCNVILWMLCYATYTFMLSNLCLRLYYTLFDTSEMILLTSDKSSIYTSNTHLLARPVHHVVGMSAHLIGSHVLTYQYTILSTYLTEHMFWMQIYYTYFNYALQLYIYIYISFKLFKLTNSPALCWLFKCYFQVTQALRSDDSSWTLGWTPLEFHSKIA